MSQPSVRRNTQRPDLILQASWRDNQVRFAGGSKALCKRQVGHGSREQCAILCRLHEYEPPRYSAVAVRGAVLGLEKRRVSGVDLSGNGVLVAPGLSVFRSGSPNKFPASRSLKRVYAGSSSLVARVFLLKPEYNAVSKIRDEVQARGGDITYRQCQRR